MCAVIHGCRRITDLMHHVERTRRWKHFGSPGFDEGRDGAVGDGHGVGDAETALDPVDVIAKESVKRF